MKHPVLLLALLTSTLSLRAQDTVPVPPPPAEDVFFEIALPAPLPALLDEDVLFEVPLSPPREGVFLRAATEPAPAGERVLFLAQSRPDESRDRNAPRTSPEPRSPNALNPLSPGERGDPYSRAGESRSSYSTLNSSDQHHIVKRDTRGRATRPVIVTSKPLDAKEFAAAEEDLGIMARLLEKEIEREAGAGGPPNAMGIALTRLDGRGPSVMLLEGYGAVFTFTTRMPLIPPPVRATEKKPEQPTDSPWDRTRRELFGPSGGEREVVGSGGRFQTGAPGAGVRDYGGGAGMNAFGGSSGSGKLWIAQADHVAYDAKKVEELKKSILEALKQAGNIRALKADDYLTVVVQGGSGGVYGPMEMAVETRTTTSSPGGPPRTETFVKGPAGGDGPRSGTLTVRAKKSDAEDFAKGKLTAEQFTKKALVNLH